MPPTDHSVPSPAAPRVRSCPSFQDLFLAAKGRHMEAAELGTFQRLPQSAINELVRTWADETGGAFRCEDRLGTDGVVYTAFEACGP